MAETKSQTISKLEKLLKRRRSKSWYAEKLAITIGEVDDLISRIKGKENYSDEETKRVNVEKGTIESTLESAFDPKTVDELASLHKIDLKRYKITNYWSKLKANGRFTSSVFATLIKEDSVDKFQEKFIDFLKTYKSSYVPVERRKPLDNKYEPVSLILPKQDAHFNKWDVKGENDIEFRFNLTNNATWNILHKASFLNQLEEIVYIVGSDQFNSEWTSLTTKGTPQTNILTYQESFKAICRHEIEILTDLLYYSEKVKVIFVPGNHDEYVGWHLINLLETYFKDESRIEFDSKEENTKYHKYGNSAFMLNHGDAMKPKDLAHRFPIGFKEEWSSCENYYILTGDKHHELSMDIHGIKFFQLPQLSKATSKWDDKQGFTCNKAEMTAFVISKNNGMSEIYKEIL